MTSPRPAEWVLDPVWFPIWADIVIPTFLGISTVAVAIVAVLASYRAQKLARESAAREDEQNQRMLRHTMATELGTNRRWRYDSYLEKIRALSDHGPDAQRIVMWANEQRNIALQKGIRLRRFDGRPSEAEVSIDWEYKRRLSRWAITGEFDSSPHSFYPNRKADPPAGDEGERVTL